MNTRKSKSKFKNSRILLEIVCSFTIVMGRLIEKLCPEKYAPMQWNTQAGDIRTNLKFKIDATNVVTWNFHVGDSAKVRYNMILGRAILT